MLQALAGDVGSMAEVHAVDRRFGQIGQQWRSCAERLVARNAATHGERFEEYVERARMQGGIDPADEAALPRHSRRAHVGLDARLQFASGPEPDRTRIGLEYLRNRCEKRGA